MNGGRECSSERVNECRFVVFLRLSVAQRACFSFGASLEACNGWKFSRKELV